MNGKYFDLQTELSICLRDKDGKPLDIDTVLRTVTNLIQGVGHPIVHVTKFKSYWYGAKDHGIRVRYVHPSPAVGMGTNEFHRERIEDDNHVAAQIAKRFNLKAVLVTHSEIAAHLQEVEECSP